MSGASNRGELEARSWWMRLKGGSGEVERCYGPGLGVGMKDEEQARAGWDLYTGRSRAETVEMSTTNEMGGRDQQREEGTGFREGEREEGQLLQV